MVELEDQLETGEQEGTQKPKRGRGRPRKQPVLAAPSKFEDEREKKGWELVRACPDDEVLYLYRLLPVLDLSRIGIDSKAIEKIAAPALNEEYIRTQHGAGKYQIRQAGNGFSFTVGIYDPELLAEPPRFDVRAMVKIDPNDTWAELYKRRGIEIPAYQGATNGNNNGGDRKEMDQITKTLLDRALAPPPAPAAGAPNDMMMGLFNLMLQQQQQNQTMLLTVLSKMMDRPQVKENGGSNGTPLTPEQTLDLIDRIRDTTIDTVSANMGGKISAAAAIGKEVVDLIRATVPQIPAIITAAKAAAPQQQPATPGGQAALPAPPPEASMPAVSQYPHVPPQEEEAMLPDTVVIAARGHAHFPMAMRMFLKEAPGDSFASYLIDVADDERLYRALANQEGKGVLGYLKQFPEWREVGAGKSEEETDGRFLVWWSQFRSYLEPETETPAEAAPPAVEIPATAAKKEKKK